MKIVQIILILLAISQIYYTNSAERRHRNRGPANNKFYNLVMGCLGELSGGNPGDIQACLPNSWKTQDDAADLIDSVTISESSDVFSTILKVVGGGVKAACAFKPAIKGLLARRLMRSEYRLLIERRVRKPSSILGAISKGGSKIINAGSKVVDKVSDVAKKFADALKPVFNKLTDIFKKLLSSGLLNKVTELFPCLEQTKNASKQVVGVVKSIKAKLNTLLKGSKKEVIGLLIDLICNFEDFKAAINFVVQAAKDSNVLNKFTLTGKFFGRLFFALSKTRRFRKYNRRLRNY